VVDVKLSDLEVPLSSIRPGPLPPLTLQDASDGVSIVLHFGKESPREHVTAIVVTIMNKSPDRLTDLELKAVVPKGCRVKLQAASGSELPPHNPFVPPPAITQVMLVANPNKAEVSLKYVLSYLQNGEEPQTEMGEVAKLPVE
jgi:ADP-ribosylation factor-binding protein GGA